jgi:GNAT superfamily N-acetyltransferase
MSRTQGPRTQGTDADRPARAADAIRPACPADTQALSDFLSGLSAQTRYLRFFAPVTPAGVMLRLLSGGSGHADAVVAVRDGAIIGHAMAVDQPGSWPRRTDVGVVVADAWHGHGVGSALMRTLVARARARGVTSATMDVLPGNRRVLAMITAHWPSACVTRSPDFTTISCPLSPPARPSPRSGEGEGDGVQGQADARADHGAVDADVLEIAPEEQLQLA